VAARPYRLPVAALGLSGETGEFVELLATDDCAALAVVQDVRDALSIVSPSGPTSRAEPCARKMPSFCTRSASIAPPSSSVARRRLSGS
jgi:hypothetical protein